MKYILAVSTILIFKGCKKEDQTSETVEPTKTANDSAKSIFIVIKSNTNVSSIAAYNANGNFLWDHSFPGIITFWSNMDISEYNVFLTNYYHLESINTMSGNTNWNYANSGNLVVPKIENDTIVSASSIIPPSTANKLVLFDKTTGSVLWSKAITDQPIATPFLNGGKVFSITTYSSGVVFRLSSYDVASNSLLWQTTLSNNFTVVKTTDFIVRHNTLIVGMSTGVLYAVNINNRNLYWSVAFNTNKSYLYNNQIVYNNLNTGKITYRSLKDGTIIKSYATLQYLATSGETSYIYNNSYYSKSLDSVFCTSLTDGTIKFRTYHPGYFEKFIVVGDNLYDSQMYYNSTEESKLMILNTADFTAKDSIIVSKVQLVNFSILSSQGIFY